MESEHGEGAERALAKVKSSEAATPFPKMSAAREGRSQAHMDVLVAVFGKGVAASPNSKASRPGPRLINPQACEQESH